MSLSEVAETKILKLLREKKAVGHAILRERAGQARDDETSAVKNRT